MKTSSGESWRSALGSIVVLLACLQAQAQGLAKPLGPVVLTVSGQISQRNSPQGAQFDAAMLQALPTSSFATPSQWHTKPVRPAKLRGLLRHLLQPDTLAADAPAPPFS